MVLKIHISDDIVEINNDNIISSSYKTDSSSDNELQFGFASSAGLNFSIIDFDGTYASYNFTGCIVEMWNDAETKRKGMFKIVSVSKRKDVTNFTCLDFMSKFDIRYTNESFTGTVSDLLDDICTLCSVEQGSSLTSFLHSDVNIPSSEPFLNMNCREIIQAICELSGCFAIMDKDGKLQFKWYDLTNIDKTIVYSSLFDLERTEEENNIINVSGVVSGKEIKTSGGGYELVLSNNNPIIYNHTEDEIQTFLDEIKEERLDNFKYYTLNLKTRIDWDLEVGDVINVQDRDTLYYKAIVTNLTYTNDSGMTITSSGENRERTYNTINNNNANDNSPVFMFRKHKTTDASSKIEITNIKESSQVFLNVSDKNLDGYFSIKLIDDVLYSIDGNGCTSFGMILPLETTMSSNILTISSSGVEDLEISLVCVNCKAKDYEGSGEFASLLQYTEYNNGKNNLWEIAHLNKEEITSGGGTIGGGGLD